MVVVVVVVVNHSSSPSTLFYFEEQIIPGEKAVINYYSSSLMVHVGIPKILPPINPPTPCPEAGETDTNANPYST